MIEVAITLCIIWCMVCIRVYYICVFKNKETEESAEAFKKIMKDSCIDHNRIIESLYHDKHTTRSSIEKQIYESMKCIGVNDIDDVNLIKKFKRRNDYEY